MVTVSSAFISSRRERMMFSVLSASGCACKPAVCVDVLRVLDEAGFAEPDFGKTDLDNTDVARDHSFHCIARTPESGPPLTILRMWGLWFQYSSNSTIHFFQLPSGFRKPVDDRLSFMPLRKTQAGGRLSASLPAWF